GGAGARHDDRGLRPRLSRFCREAEARLRGQLMTDLSFLDWPFFDAHHRAWRERVNAFAAGQLGSLVNHRDVDGSCRKIVAALGSAGLLAPAVVQAGRFDVRTLCLARETLAWHDGLADFAFALQGLGSGPIS